MKWNGKWKAEHFYNFNFTWFFYNVKLVFYNVNTLFYNVTAQKYNVIHFRQKNSALIRMLNSTYFILELILLSSSQPRHAPLVSQRTNILLRMFLLASGNHELLHHQILQLLQLRTILELEHLEHL